MANFKTHPPIRLSPHKPFSRLDSFFHTALSSPDRKFQATWELCRWSAGSSLTWKPFGFHKYPQIPKFQTTSLIWPISIDCDSRHSITIFQSPWGTICRRCFDTFTEETSVQLCVFWTSLFPLTSQDHFWFNLLGFISFM